MSVRTSILALLAALSALGCQTTAQIMDSLQPQAISVATRRGQFEMNCPAAAGTLLSREAGASGDQGPRFGGVVRAEYTVGVSGCGQRATLSRHLSGRRLGLLCGGRAQRYSLTPETRGPVDLHGAAAISARRAARPALERALERGAVGEPQLVGQRRQRYRARIESNDRQIASQLVLQRLE